MIGAPVPIMLCIVIIISQDRILMPPIVDV